MQKCPLECKGIKEKEKPLPIHAEFLTKISLQNRPPATSHALEAAAAIPVEELFGGAVSGDLIWGLHLSARFLCFYFHSQYPGLPGHRS